MAFILGIFLFALGIAATIALHEAGHMISARAFGMRVRRFYVGFGPSVFSFTKGHTRYGVAALPLGGFCDIAGMTAMDELTEDEKPHAMYSKPAWQRIVVLAAGPFVNIVLGLFILFLVAASAGLPDPHADVRATVGEVTCSADQKAPTQPGAPAELEDCTGDGAGGRAGVQTGDIITALNGEELESFVQLRDEVQARPGETVTLDVERGDRELQLEVELDSVVRYDASGNSQTVGSVGLASAPLDIHREYSVVGAIPASLDYSWFMLKATVQGIIAFPGKIPDVAASIFGGERDQDGPISVVGASRAGGELVERELWPMFWMMLATLNFFLALFNMIPLPPFDGGHIAVVLWEKIRNGFRRLRGQEPGGPANYEKLLPLTYGMAALLLTVGVIVIIADLVNPIVLF
ncbi:M50 family metallopeptidase [Corynebacterium sp. MNWGS58]|uniref:M50 family metallopeptidase n=1 Tax=Corynebacterium sp. 102791.4 TaxID=3104612 RepID=UPI0035152B76